MKVRMVVIGCIVVMALVISSCDVPVSSVELVETVAPITEASGTESIALPSVSATPTPKPVADPTSDNKISETTEISETSSDSNDNESDDDPNDDSSSDTGFETIDEASNTTYVENSSSRTSSTIPEEPTVNKPSPTSTPVPEKPKYARSQCFDCGNKTLVDVPDYRWTEPASTHDVTESSFSGGISHQYIEIVWYEDCDYNGHASEAPLIQVPFQYEIDSEYQVVDDNEYYLEWTAAVKEAYAEAEAWLDSVGAHENGINNFTYLTCAGRLELFNYEEHTYTVVDEPEHEYECGAYVCDTCGAVCFYGEVRQLR